MFKMKRQDENWEDELRQRLDDALAHSRANHAELPEGGTQGLNGRILARTRGLLARETEVEWNMDAQSAPLRFAGKRWMGWGVGLRVAAMIALAAGVGAGMYFASTAGMVPGGSVGAISYEVSDSGAAASGGASVAQISAQLNQLATMDQPQTLLDEQISQLRAQVALVENAGVWSDSPAEQQAVDDGASVSGLPSAYGSSGNMPRGVAF